MSKLSDLRQNAARDYFADAVAVIEQGSLAVSMEHAQEIVNKLNSLGYCAETIRSGENDAVVILDNTKG